MSVATEVERRPRYSFGTGTVASSVDLRVADGVSFEEWKAIGRRLLGFADSSKWWIGDWLAYGEWSYGEKSKVVREELHKEYDEVRHYAYVAANVPRSIRRDPSEVSWSHHRLLAPLVPTEQERWLALAADNGWSHSELKEELQHVLQLSGGEDKEGEVAAVVVRLSFPAEREQRWQEAASRRGLSLQAWLEEAGEEKYEREAA